MNDAASAFSVTGQEVNRRIFARPAEALAIVPGLVITQHSGEGKANQYFLRGSTSTTEPTSPFSLTACR
jgi:hypothetical protein